MSTLDSREPPNGDFVAYVEKIEREQLVRAMRPHKLPQLPVGGTVAQDDASRTLSAAEAQRVVDLLKVQGRTGATPVGASIGALIGAGLIAFGLLAEGGMFLVLLGAFLLWRSLRKLRGAVPTTLAAPIQQVEAVFGRNAPTGAGKRKA
jgi:hypothetical protein